MREMRECQNPICQNRIEPVATDNGKKAWRRTPRRFCSDSCKKDFYALTRVTEMLLPLGPARGWEILHGLGNGDTQGKALGENVSSRANVDEVSWARLKKPI